MPRHDKTLTPQDIAEGYMRSYYALHGRQPKVRFMGGTWYQVNGEIVHRSTLTSEMIRLRQLAQKTRTVERNVIQRLISRIRAI